MPFSRKAFHTLRRLSVRVAGVSISGRSWSSPIWSLLGQQIRWCPEWVTDVWRHQWMLRSALLPLTALKIHTLHRLQSAVKHDMRAHIFAVPRSRTTSSAGPCRATTQLPLAPVCSLGEVVISRAWYQCHSCGCFTKQVPHADCHFAWHVWTRSTVCVKPTSDWLVCLRCNRAHFGAARTLGLKAPMGFGIGPPWALRGLP